MGCEKARTAQGPFRVKTVRGEPYQVGERTLIPVTRIVSLGRARATIASDSISGWGGGLVQIVPLALIEETSEGERRIAITDATAATLRQMLVVAIATTWVFAAIRWLARRLRRAKGKL